MLLSNLPILIRMFTDPNYLRFARAFEKRLKSDPNYSLFKSIKLFTGLVRGEKILRFGGVYIINGWIPPIPSRAIFTFMDGAKDKCEPLSDLAYLRRSAPLATSLCVTERCNYKCAYCSVAYRKQGDELSTSQWINTIASLQDLGSSYIGFTGGEPLLRDDLEEIIQSVDNRSITQVATNGELLSTDRARSLKSAGLFAVAISLDSADPEKHNKRRGNSAAFTAALAAIRNASTSGLYTIVLSVVYKNEISKKALFDLFKLVKRHGAHEMSILQPVPCGRLLHAENRTGIYYSQRDREHIFKIQTAANHKLKGFPKVNSLFHLESPNKFGCTAGILYSHITASGEFCPCDYIAMSFGNVLEEKVSDLYNKMRQAVGGPKRSCWAISLAKHLRGKELPLNPEESIQVCLLTKPQTYPRLYRDLQPA